MSMSSKNTPPPSPEAPRERIQKRLAREGYGSRRLIERWIEEGRLTLNGRVARLGDQVTPSDRIELEGRFLKPSPHQLTRLLMYYKPVGVLCSRASEKGRPTVYEHLPTLSRGRWISVGRLDLNTSGLLMLTNDGNWAHHLMHPRFCWEREYHVRAFGLWRDELLELWTQGVELEGKLLRFKSVERLDLGERQHHLRLILEEGHYREIRRMLANQGLTVSRLKRVRFGPFVLPKNLKPGQVHEFSSEEILNYRSLLGI